MTRGEAEAVLYLIDQLKERGARQITVSGVSVVFDAAQAEGAKPDAPKKPSRTEKLGLGFYKDAPQ